MKKLVIYLNNLFPYLFSFFFFSGDPGNHSAKFWASKPKMKQKPSSPNLIRSVGPKPEISRRLFRLLRVCFFVFFYFIAAAVKAKTQR